MRKRKTGYTISAVAETFQIHPQTLRLYEREGLLKPSRSEGNTRFYSEEDLERLEVILNLTRDLGVNLAGIDIILQMRTRMEQMQKEMMELVEYFGGQMADHAALLQEKLRHSLVRMPPAQIVLRPQQRERKSKRS